MTKRKKIISVLLVFVILFSGFPLKYIIPYFDVIPGMIEVGVDYIDLDFNRGAVTKKELKNALAETEVAHPFVLATKENFDIVRREYITKSYNSYAQALCNSVLSNAQALLDEKIYPPMEYVLDEENSILPISRETISRMVILGYAWQVTGEKKYAARAWKELEKVCSFNDWCPSHFLAAAEMALAVSIGYDWFYDYLTQSQKDLLAEKTYEYAIKPALSKNYLKNWFTWSKNNWNSICYSGVGIACMTFGSYCPDEAAEFLKMCYTCMPIAFSNFTPDGVYAEGPGYSQSGMNAIVNFVATSKNYLSTDYGMSDIAGFKELGKFPVYITTPTGVFNFGDNKARMCFSPSLHWYAAEYDSPLLSCYQMWDMPETFTPNTSKSTERNGDGKEDALSSLWYDRSYSTKSADFSSEPLAVCLDSDAGQTLTLIRSAYLDKDASFAGIKGGYNFINHGDLDIGTFVFDIMGERWAEELGAGSYDAPGYFTNVPAGGRWKNYCKRAEGQNTLVINPDMTLDDQYVLAECGFTSFEETDDGGKCSLDMTDAYRMNGALKVTRDFELYNDYSSLKISDNILCVVPSEIYWFMHTKADIDISADGKTAILTIGDKKLKATSHSDGTFSVMKAERLKGEWEYDDEYSDIRKLTVKLEKVKKAEICITLEALSQ
jgi:hypothetical protein